MRRVKALLIISLLLVLTTAAQGLAAPLSQEPIWNVTTPNDGSVLSGEVTIQGTASHPNFSSYGVLYATGARPAADSQWVPVVFGVESMVVNGPLATWDTTQVPDGQYTLALAVYEVGNDTPFLHFVNNITIKNADLTPTPTETATPTEVPAGEPGTEQPTAAEPIIAPTIEQPPTVTPRPVEVQEEGATEVPESEEEAEAKEGTFSTGAIREAFFSGVWIAVLLYIIGGLYFAGRIAYRYYQRQQQKGK